MEDTSFNITQAASYLNVSPDTLRRWDRKGKLVAHRTKGNHRFYYEEDLAAYKRDIFALAKKWMLGTSVEPETIYYCPTSIVFKGRLSKLQNDLEKTLGSSDYVSLLVAVVGEIGNNSFDHNLGNWPDTIGVFFAYNVNKKQIVVADRGRGLLKTLRRVRPSLRNDSEAAQVAFTERVSGRAPEARGNGLKLVRNIVTSMPILVDFYSGNAQVTLDKKMKICENDLYYSGCIVLISYL